MDSDTMPMPPMTDWASSPLVRWDADPFCWNCDRDLREPCTEVAVLQVWTEPDDYCTDPAGLCRACLESAEPWLRELVASGHARVPWQLRKAWTPGYVPEA